MEAEVKYHKSGKFKLERRDWNPMPGTAAPEGEVHLVDLNGLVVWGSSWSEAFERLATMVSAIERRKGVEFEPYFSNLVDVITESRSNRFDPS
jgi:hypothetical protein